MSHILISVSLALVHLIVVASGTLNDLTPTHIHACCPLSSASFPYCVHPAPTLICSERKPRVRPPHASTVEHVFQSATASRARARLDSLARCAKINYECVTRRPAIMAAFATTSWTGRSPAHVATDSQGHFAKQTLTNVRAAHAGMVPCAHRALLQGDSTACVRLASLAHDVNRISTNA
jgi:hypothetical protein